MPPRKRPTQIPSKREVLIELWHVVKNAKSTREKIAGMQAMLRHMPEDTDAASHDTLRKELRDALRLPVTPSEGV